MAIISALRTLAPKCFHDLVEVVWRTAAFPVCKRKSKSFFNIRLTHCLCSDHHGNNIKHGIDAIMRADSVFLKELQN